MNRQETQALLNIILDRITQEQQISTDSYAILLTLFPTVIAPALEILDEGKITKVICEQSKRHFYKVKSQSASGGSGFKVKKQPLKPDLKVVGKDEDGSDQIFDVIGDFCWCYFYAKECLSESGSSMYCKHVLASKLAEAIGSVQVKEIEDRDFAPLMLGSRAYLQKYDEKIRY